MNFNINTDMMRSHLIINKCYEINNYHSYTANKIMMEKLDYILHIIFALFVYNMIFYIGVILFGLHWKVALFKVFVNIIIIMILIYKMYSLIKDQYMRC